MLLISRSGTDLPVVALSSTMALTPFHAQCPKRFFGSITTPGTFFLIGTGPSGPPDVVSHQADDNEWATTTSKWPHVLTLMPSSSAYLRTTEKQSGNKCWIEVMRVRRWRGNGPQLRLAPAHGYKCRSVFAYPHDPMRPPVWYMRWLVAKILFPYHRDPSYGISDPITWH